MPGIPWSPDDKSRLVELVQKGLGPVSIQRLGVLTANDRRPRSLHAIAQQIRRMHLAQPEISEKARMARMRGRSITAEQRHSAEDYLTTHGSAVPIHHVVERFGVTESWTRRSLKNLRISRVWAETAAHPFSRFHDPGYRAEVSARVRRQARERAAAHRATLVALAEKILSSSPTVPRRSCENCGHSFPLQSEFFPACHRATTGQTYYLHLCRGCAAERRRQPKSQPDGLSATGDLSRDEGLRSQRLRRILCERRDNVRTAENRPQERACRACWQEWPLLSDFWRTSRTQKGTVLFDPRCRLCENARRRSASKGRITRKVLAQSIGVPA